MPFRYLDTIRRRNRLINKSIEDALRGLHDLVALGVDLVDVAGRDVLHVLVAVPDLEGVEVAKVPRVDERVLGDDDLLAAIALSEGAGVTLFSAYGAELAALRGAGGIVLRGAGRLAAPQPEGHPAVRHRDDDQGHEVLHGNEDDAEMGNGGTLFQTQREHKCVHIIGPLLSQTAN